MGKCWAGRPLFHDPKLRWSRHTDFCRYRQATQESKSWSILWIKQLKVEQCWVNSSYQIQTDRVRVFASNAGELVKKGKIHLLQRLRHLSISAVSCRVSWIWVSCFSPSLALIFRWCVLQIRSIDWEKRAANESFLTRGGNGCNLLLLWTFRVFR